MNSDKEIIIENISVFHSKIREVSYWHFIFVNNGTTNSLDEYFNFKADRGFKKELKSLISESESYIIFEKYLKAYEGLYFISYNDLNSLIKDLTLRICTSILSKLSEKDIVDVLWDSKLENFSFKINSNYLDSDVITTNDFLFNIYSLGCKHLNLKNHYDNLRAK
jgi:hypothetical protein